MRQSTRMGVLLALFLTMLSSLVVRDDSSGESPFGLQTAQAGVGHLAGSPALLDQRPISLKEAAQRLKRRNELVARVRMELLAAAPATVSGAR